MSPSTFSHPSLCILNKVVDNGSGESASQEGHHIVAICDLEGGLIHPEENLVLLGLFAKPTFAQCV